ncbi:MAG: hypothetical protein QXK89_09820 [Candidatus Bathyarchaeia archaeon]
MDYIGYSGSFFGMNMTQVTYWDKSTGILCEMFMEISMLTDIYITTILTSQKMIETSLWKITTEVSCSVSKSNPSLL